ncbi:NUDIX domain-containing protein [Parasalinivibrio latis]|uniref:NUDIX domain-containing protein n=1 Tax=Parasalinivibrio latis TaxID=2952610 RepID=UPI0030E5A7B3
MQHRIRAAGIAVKNDAILLVKHTMNNRTFWIPPGGGREDCDVTTKDTVIRELKEESGLDAEAGPLIFIREFAEISGDTYHLELYYLLENITGDITLKNLEGLGRDEYYISETRWVSLEEAKTLKIYPACLIEETQKQLSADFIVPQYLGRETEGDY